MIENRLVGESGFENAVLRTLVQDKLCEFSSGGHYHQVEVSLPGERGIMAAEGTWCHGLLACEVWIEARLYYKDPCPEHYQDGNFELFYMWRTPEREGCWYELADIFERGSTKRPA